MITIGMDPNLISLGPVIISWHGLLTALGVVAGVLLAAEVIRRAGGKVVEDEVYATALWGVLGGIVGARLLHVVDRWEFYSVNPFSILAVQQGGIAIMGAILGGILGGFLYAWRRGLSLGPLADAGAFGLLIGQIIGRIGCTINGDSWGAPTDLPWGLVYTHPGAFAPLGVAGHPWPIYEMLWNVLTLALLWRLRGRLQPDGMTMLLYLALYSVGRFFLTFLRQEQPFLFGLQEAHIFSLLTFLVAAPLAVYLAQRGTAGGSVSGQLPSSARR